MTLPILTVQIRCEHDVVLARQRARAVCALLGFDAGDRTRIGTAVSEIARNTLVHAQGGEMALLLKVRARPQMFLIRVRDRGPGIDDVVMVMEGRCPSGAGMGHGIVGARRLMDFFRIESTPGKGTTVSLGKKLPPTAPVVTAGRLAQVTEELIRHAPQTPFEEIRQQNQELMRALQELRQRQEDLEAMNRELEDTNRGIVALYAELDEKAAHLNRANELKARFLSNMSHEFRTPLNAIVSLSGFLLDRMDGDLTEGQEKQVTFIKKSAEELSGMVNDLLDIAKIEAGKLTVQPVEFRVENLFSALRGMLRPILVNPEVNLVFEEAFFKPPLCTDEGKLSQILRNFISNAIKFTEKGEIRVRASLDADGQAVLSVSDTGIGIPETHLDRVFDEYVQLDSPLQKKVKGTGLGLSLSRKLAALLGGRLEVKSAPGRGSTFSAIIPARLNDGPDSVDRPPLRGDGPGQ